MLPRCSSKSFGSVPNIRYDVCPALPGLVRNACFVEWRKKFEQPKVSDCCHCGWPHTKDTLPNLQSSLLLSMKVFNIVCFLVLVGFACPSSVIPQSTGEELTSADAQPLPEILSREKEVALALSAGPEHLRQGAAVYALERNGFVKVRDGSNGFTCIVNRDHPLNQKPVCFDAEGTATILPKALRWANCFFRVNRCRTSTPKSRKASSLWQMLTRSSGHGQ